jgi:multicomponent Na+:H+ antiporter subunit E
VRAFTGARLLLVLWLTAVWVALWGSVTPANVLGGLAVGLALLAVPTRDAPAESAATRAHVHPLGLLRFLGFFAVALVRASVEVLVLVLRPRVRLRQAVVAVPVRGASDAMLTLLANAISLTPGTLTLEVDRDKRVLYVHALQVPEGPDGLDRVRRDIAVLERYAARAIGGPAALDAYREGGRR